MTNVVVHVDLNRCEGHGLCELTAPNVYRLDSDGLVELVHDRIPAEQLSEALAGARVCPVAALRVES